MDLINKIQNNLIASLPGIDVQYRMAPLGRAESVTLISNYSVAAVLCLIYPKNDIPHMVFIKRAGYENDKHRDQIAFPGGKMELTDKDFTDTALREAWEEVGVIPESVEILGALTPLKIPVSKYEVFPVMAHTYQTPVFISQPSEVESIIELPIHRLLDPQSVKFRKIKLFNGIYIDNVPVFEIDDCIIWGATAMILSEVVHLMK